jgi:hypothetical protein
MVEPPCCGLRVDVPDAFLRCNSGANLFKMYAVNYIYLKVIDKFLGSLVFGENPG